MDMTPRQRWLAILNKRTPDRIPTDIWATPEVKERLKRELNCADEEAMRRRLDLDAPLGLAPVCKLKHHPNDEQADIWGVRHTKVNYGTGTYSEPTYHPLAHMTSVDEVHAFRWPRAEDYDYEPIRRAVREHDGYRLIRAGTFEPFMMYGFVRGLEQSFEDLLSNPDIAEAILQHLFDFGYAHNRRIFEAGEGRIDMTYIAEDLGHQTGPLFSLDLYRRYLLPNQKKMADLARSYKLHIIYHTDGAARSFLPDLVDVVGIDILNPIQWRCPGMDREGLVRDYGRKIAFHGSIDNQHTLPYGSVDEVIAEVKQSIDIYKGARWICAPCHNIQPVTPTANILAMYDTIRTHGKL